MFHALCNHPYPLFSRIFYKWQLPKGIFPNGNFPNVQFPKWQLPRLEQAGGPSAVNSTDNWEIAYLGSCHLEKLDNRNCSHSPVLTNKREKIISSFILNYFLGNGNPRRPR